MKKKLLGLLLLVFLLAGDISSQAVIKPAFLSVSNKYEFTLPQLDVSLPLPATAGFLVPHFTGKNIKLEVDDITCYYFDLSYLEKPKSFCFYFALPAQQGTKNLLAMNIVKLDKAEVEKMANTAVSGKDGKWVSGIKSKVGKSISYQWLSKNGSANETHIITKGEFSFLFTLNVDMDKKLKKRYLNIIKGFKEKNQPYLKVRYETRVKNGEFEPKAKEVQKPVVAPKGNEGKLTASTVFEWEKLGYSVEIPENWEYKIEGDLIAEDAKHAKVMLGESFFEDNFMTMSWFRNDEIALVIRSYREWDLPDMLNRQAEMTKYFQKMDVIVDGVSLQAWYYGSLEFGSFDICFNAKEVNHWISFSGVTKQMLPLLQQMLSTIRIENSQPDNTRGIVSDLGNLLELEELTLVELDEPLALDHNWPDGELFDCRLVDLDVKVKLPGKYSDYMYTIGSLKGTIDDGIVKGLPENDTDKRLSVFALNKSPLSINISKKTQTIPHETYIQGFKRGWSIYRESEFLHGSIAHANGLEWSICIVKNNSHYLGIYVCYIEGYEIMITTHSQSKEEVYESVATIKNVFYEK